MSSLKTRRFAYILGVKKLLIAFVMLLLFIYLFLT